MADIGRRAVLAGLAAGAAVPLLGTDRARAASWRLKWSPVASSAGLNAFEGVEDWGLTSHGGSHIYVKGNDYRFTVHTVDREAKDDRQRSEVKGMRSDGSLLTVKNGQTWRWNYRMWIPGTLKATTSFTHIFQTKMPGTGTLPLTVMSLRHTGGVPKIEFRIYGPDITVGSVDLVPLQDKWIDVEIEQRIGNGSAGRVRWALRDAGSTVIDATRNGDTYLDDVVRPKWGIYRSLDDSAHLVDTYLLLRDMKAYQYA
ncbi:Tat pathway signal sequence domain protein [Umezawaea tangerina]|uniref:Polysaccharide lyase-like protein n=1 Tax=Umezawaea tangerina TaxID=84725 RepID=A0A2T0SXT6_9PSEU|nr:Tat pathway signal sequence domain protein [Umezawaea tangerina]PRY38232.1 hypothetical protein CLV43_109453 [Umezawaea tangerina]